MNPRTDENVTDISVLANFEPNVPSVDVSDTRLVEGASGISSLVFTVSLSEIANGEVNNRLHSRGRKRNQRNRLRESEWHANH